MANSDKSASNMPATIKINAACTLAAAFEFRFEPVYINNMKAQTVDTQVCAAKSRAAMLPACAGVGRCANSMGTTKKPMQLRLTHQNAAIQSGNRAFMSDVADRHHLIVLDAAWGLHFGSVPLLLTNQSTRNWATDID